MNAYELADKLESFWLTKNDDLLIKTITMLRQQADQIAELEKDLYMIQRHYDQLETFSPSGKNAQTVSNTDENLQNGKL